MKYTSLRREWLLIKEPLASQTDPRAWPECDGVIIAMQDPVLLRTFVKKFRHVVNCSGAADRELTSIVCVDDYAVGQLAAAHLIDCRLRHFAYYGVAGHRVSDQRLAGFRDALKARGFSCAAAPLRHVWQRPLRTGWQAHWPSLVNWLRSLRGPLGLLTMDDTAAEDVAAACLDGGIHIPDQVAVIGVNNDDLLCEGAWPPLSSVSPDYYHVGETAAALLDRLMKGEKVRLEDRQILLPPVGVVGRTSTDVLAVDDPQLAAAVRFIRQNACKGCTVPEVLREVPVGRRWLERQFQQKLGRTVWQEIVHVRVEQARRLLLKPEYSVLQIYELCGYRSLAGFNRAFRQATGESPGAFRRRRIRRV